MLTREEIIDKWSRARKDLAAARRELYALRREKAAHINLENEVEKLRIELADVRQSLAAKQAEVSQAHKEVLRLKGKDQQLVDARSNLWQFIAAYEAALMEIARIVDYTRKDLYLNGTPAGGMRKLLSKIDRQIPEDIRRTDSDW